MREHALGVVTRAIGLPNRDAHAAREPGEEQRALHLRAGDGRGVREIAQPAAAHREREAVAPFLGDAGAHGAERLGYAPHGAAAQRPVAREARRECVARQDAQTQPRGRPRVAAKQRSVGLGERVATNFPHPAVPNGRDLGPELPEHPRRGLHVVAREQAVNLARAARERGEHDGAVGDALVAGDPDRAADLHRPTLRRQSAARVSQSWTARASAVSSARTSLPSGSSRARSTVSTSSRFIRRISVHSDGLLAARRVVSSAPGPNVAPGGVWAARTWASSEAVICGTWLVTASCASWRAASMMTGSASSTACQKCAISRAAAAPPCAGVTYTTAPRNRSPREAAKPRACV